MSINPELHEGVVPYLVSPYENFFFLIQRVKLTVESGRCVAWQPLRRRLMLLLCRM